MPVMFFLSLGIIILVLIVYTIYRARQFRTHTRRPSLALSVADLKKRDDAILSAQVQKSDTEKAAVLEAYPALREIHYAQTEEGLFPVSYLAVDETIKKTLEVKVSALPPVSTASIRLLGLLRDPESNPSEITSLVSTNPVFSAKVLQTINSVYFNLSEKVTSVGRAITLLGYNNVRSLVMEDILCSATPVRDKDHDLYVKIWSHSAAVSACAGHLGKTVFHLSEYALGTIGLLHDIGKYFFDLLEKRMDSPTDPLAIIGEEKQYGMNHAIIGSIIAKKWQLPEAITEAIEHHHSPTFFPPENIPVNIMQQSLVICLADLICKVLGYTGQDSELLPVRDEYFQKFGLRKDLAELVTPALIRDIEKAHQTVLSYVNRPSP